MDPKNFPVLSLGYNKIGAIFCNSGFKEIKGFFKGGNSPVDFLFRHRGGNNLHSPGRRVDSNIGEL